LASMIWNNELVSNNLFWQRWIYVCLFVHVHIRIEWKIRNANTFVSYIQEQNWQWQRDRHTHRERERDDYKEQWIVLYLFSLNGVDWKKQDHSLQSSSLVEIKNIGFNFDIVDKCCRYAIVINKARNQFSFFRLCHEKAPVT
jgi:hypothetical protein